MRLLWRQRLAGVEEVDHVAAVAGLEPARGVHGAPQAHLVPQGSHLCEVVLGHMHL